MFPQEPQPLEQRRSSEQPITPGPRDLGLLPRPGWQGPGLQCRAPRPMSGHCLALLSYHTSQGIWTPGQAGLPSQPPVSHGLSCVLVGLALLFPKRPGSCGLGKAGWLAGHTEAPWTWPQGPRCGAVVSHIRWPHTMDLAGVSERIGLRPVSSEPLTRG